MLNYEKITAIKRLRELGSFTLRDGIDGVVIETNRNGIGVTSNPAVYNGHNSVIGLKDARDYVENLAAEIERLNPVSKPPGETLRDISDVNATLWGKVDEISRLPLGQLQLRDAERISKAVRRVFNALDSLGRELAAIEDNIRER